MKTTSVTDFHVHGGGAWSSARIPGLRAPTPPGTGALLKPYSQYNHTGFRTILTSRAPR